MNGRLQIREGRKRLLCALAVAAAAFPTGVSASESAAPSGGLTPEELAAEPPPEPMGNPLPWDLSPVDAAEVTNATAEAIFERGYLDAQGRYVVDLLQQDYAYLGVRLETPDGRAVMNAVPEVSVDGNSTLLSPEEIGAPTTSDESGRYEFAVVGGPMGLDRVTIEFANARVEIMVNVISLEAAGFPAPPEVEGGIPWSELMQARVRYKDMTLYAELPAAISERAGETVKLSGFMMPMEPDLKQRRFLLASNPPSCFFHVPGGPAGSVVVYAPEGIEVSWDPIVVEGRFEPQEKSHVGVVYRLRDARLIPH